MPLVKYKHDFFLANYVAKRYESGTTLYLGINMTIKIIKHSY